MRLRHSPGAGRIFWRGAPVRERSLVGGSLRGQLKLCLEKACPSLLCSACETESSSPSFWLFSVGLHPGHSRNQRDVTIKTQLEYHVKQGGGFPCTGKSLRICLKHSARLREEIDVFFKKPKITVPTVRLLHFINIRRAPLTSKWKLLTWGQNGSTGKQLRYQGKLSRPWVRGESGQQLESAPTSAKKQRS